MLFEPAHQLRGIMVGIVESPGDETGDLTPGCILVPRHANEVVLLEE